MLKKYKDLKWCCAPYSIINNKRTIKIEYKGKQLEDNKIHNIFLAYKDFNTKIISELVSTGAVIIKKNVFKEVGLFDENYKSGEDIDMWFRIALEYPEIGYPNKVGLNYLKQNIHSITTIDRDTTTIKNSVLIMNKTWSHIELYDESKKLDAKYVLNIWCYRLLKSIIKKRQFYLVNNLSKSAYNNLNKINKIGFPLIRYLSRLKKGEVSRNKSGI